MNKFEAAKILNISGNITQEIIKKAYRLACSKYHPDRNAAGLQMMQLVNVAYESLQKEADFSFDNKVDFGEELNAALNAIINIEGLDLEINGAWLWVGGDTFKCKDILKAAGFKWASQKKLWYFRSEDFKSYNRKQFSKEEIRAKYGSEKIETQGANKLNKAA